MQLWKLSTVPDLGSCIEITIVIGMYFAGYTKHSSETSSSAWQAAVDYPVDPASSSKDVPNLEASRYARIYHLSQLQFFAVCVGSSA